MKNNPLRHYSHIAFTILLCVCLSGCFLRPYRFPLKQGNEVGPESIAQVQIGMSANEVRYILGSPMLQDAFHENRWDYVYISRKGYDPIERYHVAIIFQNDCVAEIVQDPMMLAKTKDALSKKEELAKADASHKKEELINTEASLKKEELVSTEASPKNDTIVTSKDPSPASA